MAALVQQRQSTRSARFMESVNLARVSPDAMLKVNEITPIVGFSRTAIYVKVAAGKFPAPCKIGYSVRWRASDISDWLAAQKPASKGL